MIINRVLINRVILSCFFKLQFEKCYIKDIDINKNYKYAYNMFNIINMFIICFIKNYIYHNLRIFCSFLH